MTRRRVAVLGVALALLAVCALSALAVYSGYDALRSTGARLLFLSRADTPATLRATETYPVGGSPRLVVEGEAGGVTVTVGSAGVLEVETVKTAWGEDAAAARAAAAALAVTARLEGDTLRVAYKRPREEVSLAGRRGADTVAFNIKVPAATAVTLNAGFGDIRLVGTAGPAELRSSFGAVTVEDLAGPLTVATDAGAVSLRGLRTAGAVEASSDFGALTLTEVAAGALDASSEAGAVTVTDATVTGRLKAHSGFGPVTVRRARAGDFDLASNNGAVTAEAPTLAGTGRLALHSGFGPLRVTGARDARLALDSDNGAVSFAGTLGAGGAHTARSGFGPVTVAIPAESRLNVTLGTGFGLASTDLPLTVRGEMDDRRIEGTLNGGGPRLELRSNNGDVRLERLAPTREAK